MTTHKHLKQLVRGRMARTGESYVTARRRIVASTDAAQPFPRFIHFTGNVPVATALRVLLANAGMRAPHTGRPFTEAMVFGIGGGIGAGMFAFHYEKEDFSSFYVAGRHLWQDDVAWFQAAVNRLGVHPHVREFGGARQAERELRDALAGGPAAVWVDMAHLPYRALPPEWSGGGYHVLVVYELDDAAGTALVGDLTDQPIRLPFADLAAARARIRKQKNRVLTVAAPGETVDLRAAVQDALRACHRGLLHNRSRNFTLDAFRLWAERLHGGGKESWTRVFRRGRPLWQGLRSTCEFIEHHGTGGGLGRPLFAEFLTEAADALGDARLRSLAARYAGIGDLWSRLAGAALPENVPELAETRRLLAHKAELHHSEGEDAAGAIRAAWTALDDIGERVAHAFPLDERATDQLRLDLQRLVLEIHAQETAAATELAAVLDSSVTAGPTLS